MIVFGNFVGAAKWIDKFIWEFQGHNYSCTHLANSDPQVPARYYLHEMHKVILLCTNHIIGIIMQAV